MNVSSEDAALFLSRWKQDSPLLRIILASSTGMFNAVGLVGDFSSTALLLRGDAWEFTIPLAGVTFSFSDPRDGPPDVRESAARKYECGLELLFPDSDRLVLMEIKGSDEQHEA